MNDDFSTANFLSAIDSHGPNLGVLDSPRLEVKVSEVRRRRGRLSDEFDTGYRDIVLVERDGVLLWMDPDDLADAGGVESRRGRRGRRSRRGADDAPQGATVLREVSVPVLEPNEYLAALRRTDDQLNQECDAGVRRVRQVNNGGTVTFEATTDGLKRGYAGKTLVIVHGTFSSIKNSLSEYAATPHGIQFLADALKHYDQVLAFDHPTLSVSPFINGLDLARSLQGTTGDVDVIAHSRGGVVVRWWLEVLGDSVRGANVRAVLAGSPLKGTSLAAPNRIQPLLSVLSNVGNFVSNTLGVAAAANPFTLASFALLKFIVRREKNRWGLPPVDNIGSRPGTDAAVAVIPGLQGQAAVENNYELARLRSGSAPAQLRYFAITADFEPERIGWKLWKVITQFKDRGIDAVADKVFPAENDLVVDTAHMTSLAERRDIAPGDVYAFGKTDKVHHCSYFRQAETINQMRKWLQV